MDQKLSERFVIGVSDEWRHEIISAFRMLRTQRFKSIRFQVVIVPLAFNTDKLLFMNGQNKINLPFTLVSPVVDTLRPALTVDKRALSVKCSDRRPPSSSRMFLELVRCNKKSPRVKKV